MKADTAILSGRGPEALASIGSWSLLHELRWLFCRELERLSGEGIKWMETDTFTALLEDSLGRWRDLFTSPDLLADIELSAAPELKRWLEGQTTEGEAGLLSYLEELLKRRRAGKRVLLEEVVLPYLMWYDADERCLHWFFPNDEFLEFYDRHLVDREPVAGHTRPLYPFLPLPVLQWLRNAPGVAQPVAPAIPLERLASGMRSFQTKLIGSFYKMYNPESRLEDLIVGNGSGYVHALRDEKGQELGMLFFCTPVFGLFHELLLASERCSKRAAHRAILDTNLICLRHNRDFDQRWTGRSAPAPFPRHPFHECFGGEITSVRYVHPRAGEGEGKQATDILLCAGCDASRNGQGCPFDHMETHVVPPARFFLLGIRNLVSQRELIQARDLLHKVTHSLTGPLAAVVAGFENASRLLHDIPVEAQSLLDRASVSLAHIRNLYELNARFVQRFESGSSAEPLSRVGSGRTDLESLAEDLPRSWIFQQISDGGVTIEWRRSGTTGLVQGDRGTWLMILYILLENAYHATRAAGGARISVHATYGDGYLEGDVERRMALEITNPSPPLPPGRLEEMRLCLAGKQASMLPDSRKSQSHGLGLATVGSLLKGLGARAEIHETGSGVRIRISEVGIDE